jgi:hypothetical protein
MNDLFNIEPTTPRWLQQAATHGITATYDDETGQWTAWVEWFQSVEMESGETAEIAVNALMWRLKLGDWQEGQL